MISSRLRETRASGVIVATVVTALVGCAVGALALTWRIDQSLHDASLSLWSRPVADDIVIVAIDDASLAAIGRWPWPRAVHATLLEQLAAAPPRAIALDLLLSEPDPDPRADALLAAAMRRGAPVVLPSYFFAPPTRPLQSLLPAAPLAAAAARIAHMDAEPDEDGVLRHAWLRAGLRGAEGTQPLPHLALALLEAAGERMHPVIATELAPELPPELAPELPPELAPAQAAAQTAGQSPGQSNAADRPPAAATAAPTWRRDARVRIRYAGPPGSVRSVSYADVLRGAVPAQALAGKLVLIGATAPGLGDLHPTPVSGRGGAMAGVEVTAQLADALRAGHGLRALPPWAVGALAALLALLMHAACAGRTAGWALRVTGAALVLIPAASLLLIGAGLWLPPATLVVTALLFYLLWSRQQLARAQQLVDDELGRWPALPGPLPASGLEPRLAALRHAGDAVRQSRRLLADSVAALPEAVLVTDAAGVVQIANGQAAQLTGAADADALVGRPLADALAALTPLEATDWSALRAAALARGAPQVTRARAHRDGRELDLLARVAPYAEPQAATTATARPADADRDEPHAARGLVISLADVTRLTAAERGREELLAFVSHDLRSPQASLLAMVELARFGRLTLAPDELLDQVDVLARRTLGMADEFLRVGSTEARPLNFVVLDLAQPVREALREVAPQAQLREVALVTALATQPVRLLGDWALLRRACVNLLTNALKASAPGSQVEVEVRARDGLAVLCVRDRGPGLPDALRMRLFQRYERGAEHMHQPALLEHVGLGLALVDSIARRHGGSVQVETAPGQGSAFELKLPLADAAGASGTAVAADATGVTGAAGATDAAARGARASDTDRAA
ncbi:MAG: CHASE2 and HATPase_c domain-containing protein [Burkholderiaceae bacterium]|jgi:hypothetical protein|nr:CHASE2 and HATPase_c domain-containing protein [Burkholderiaceae bacterium]